MRFWIGFILCGLLSLTSAEAETQAERLGFPPDTRVLILHGDDLGLCDAANRAGKRTLTSGAIQSASAMVPAPEFESFARWAATRPLDVGLHLTLTSEWKIWRWGPVAPADEVAGLVDPTGHMWHTVPEVAFNASAEEVKREIRAQLARARKLGLEPTHLDSHMGTLFARPDYTKAYLQLAVENEIPAMVIEPTPEVIQRFRKQGYPITDEFLALSRSYPLPRLDDLRSVPKGKSYDDVKKKFKKLVRNLKPGLTEIVFHPADESEELKTITNRWKQRVWEGKLFEDPEIQAFFKKEKIRFTNWRKIMKRFRAKRKKRAEF